MAEKKASKDTKSKVLKSKSSISLRDKAKLSAETKPKKRRLRATAKTVGKPLQRAKAIGQKEFHIPLPDNKLGRVLGKRGRLFPKFFGEAVKELKQVSWPNRKETFKLTLAVVTFATVFGVVIAIVDYGLDKVFKELLLK